MLSLATGWYFGKLDEYLPDQVKSTTVFNRAAPAAKVGETAPASLAAPKAP